MTDPTLSSVNMGWQTPEYFLERVRCIGPIALDPCTTAANPTRAARHYAFVGAGSEPAPGWCGPDGLAASAAWAQHAKGLVFVNPPYGRELPKWVDKCLAEVREGAEIVLLVPARTDTRWFRRAFPLADSVLLRSGRIRFLNDDPAAPSPEWMWSKKKNAWVPVVSAAFPSAVFYWGPRVGMFERAFRGTGLFVTNRGP